MANAFFYANTAVATTLTGSINSAVTSCIVDSTVGWPTSYPFIIALDHNGASEELVQVTNNSSGTLTIVRAFGGTSATSHSAGAAVQHVFNAVDATDFRTHEDATTNVHGVTGDLVGTSNTQTLTNKTLTAPAITNPTVTGGGSLAGTFTGTPTFDGAITLSGTPVISAGAALSGTFTGTPTFDGVVTFNTATLHLGRPLIERAASTNTALDAQVTGDAVARYNVRVSGLTEWGDGVSGRDTNLYRSAANTLQTDDTFIAANIPGSWTAFTPTWTAASGTTTLGNGELGGRYTRIGNTVFFFFRFQWGSTTTQSVSGTNWSFSLPPISAATTGNTHMPISGWIFDNSESSRWSCTGYITPTSSTIETIVVNADGGGIDNEEMPTQTAIGGSTTSVQPGATNFNTGDRLNMWGFYEAA